MLRIQLNIIGGYLYKSPTSVSTEIQQKYLTLAQGLFNEGIQKLSALIEKEVSGYISFIIEYECNDNCLEYK